MDIIICLTEHRKFNWILTVYSKKNFQNDLYFTLKERITNNTQVDEHTFLFDEEK